MNDYFKVKCEHLGKLLDKSEARTAELEGLLKEIAGFSGTAEAIDINRRIIKALSPDQSSGANNE